MAKSKRSKTQRHKAKQNWKTPKRQNACGPETVDREEIEEIQNEAPKTRYGHVLLTRDTLESRAKRLDRMQRVRCERAVQRGRDRLRNYIPPPPERTEEEKAAHRRSDPSTWKLRGAARPWEEVEAAKTRDHHDVGFDAFERYGGELASQVEEGAKWVQSLVDLARDELERGRGRAALDLCCEALTYDSRDLSGAAFCAVEVGEDVVRRLASFGRGVPAWACAVAAVLARSDDADAVVAQACAANAAAAYSVVHWRAFDAAIEHEDALQGLDDMCAGSALEALVIHCQLRFLLEDRPGDRDALSAAVRGAGVPPLPPSDVLEASAGFPEAGMFLGMFRTAIEMAEEATAEPAAEPPSPAEPTSEPVAEPTTAEQGV